MKAARTVNMDAPMVSKAPADRTQHAERIYKMLQRMREEDGAETKGGFTQPLQEFRFGDVPRLVGHTMEREHILGRVDAHDVRT